tara:strand:+ start:350 stop:577 length:228 start_codon:yes stop_codon:yes gene_type:complete
MYLSSFLAQGSSNLSSRSPWVGQQEVFNPAGQAQRLVQGWVRSRVGHGVPDAIFFIELHPVCQCRLASLIVMLAM